MQQQTFQTTVLCYIVVTLSHRIACVPSSFKQDYYIMYIYSTAIQVMGSVQSLLCSPRLHLFNQKYSKKCTLLNTLLHN